MIRIDGINKYFYKNKILHSETIANKKIKIKKKYIL